MDKSYTFTLKKEEYLSFLRYQFMHRKENRGVKLWIMTSIPALILCTVIFLSLYRNIIWVCTGILLICLWVMYGTPKFWNYLAKRKINDTTLNQMDIKGFKEVQIHFQTHELEYQDGAKHRIAYKNIKNLMPIPDMFVFQYDEQGTFLLPYRAFENEEEMRSFLKEFELCWNSKQTASI